jgi:hypothetical protein
MMKRRFIIILLFQSLFSIAFAQESGKVYAVARIIDGDTVPVLNLREVSIEARMTWKNKRAYRRYTKLVRNVKKVYPYARLAGLKLIHYNNMLADVQDEKEKKRLMKQAEKELKEEFGEDLKDLTFSQGKILLKLVDRETGNSSFDVVEELRGKFAAFFWQSIARIFGYNLKVRYDPLNEDRQIENIVKMIESGKI